MAACAARPGPDKGRPIWSSNAVTGGRGGTVGGGVYRPILHLNEGGRPWSFDVTGRKKEYCVPGRGFGAKRITFPLPADYTGRAV